MFGKIAPHHVARGTLHFRKLRHVRPGGSADRAPKNCSDTGKHIQLLMMVSRQNMRGVERGLQFA